jgi:hypothetical protein
LVSTAFLFRKRKTASQPWQAIAQRFCSITVCRGVLILPYKNGYLSTVCCDIAFLFNIEHPVFTAGVGQDWIYTDDGKPQYWAIDNYFITGERNTHFLGCDVVKQHHTLTQIIMGLLNNGFELKVVEEAEPPKEMMDIPGMEDELRRPMMLLVKAIAKK